MKIMSHRVGNASGGALQAQTTKNPAEAGLLL
jgi:hypothetical protein